MKNFSKVFDQLPELDEIESFIYVTGLLQLSRKESFVREEIKLLMEDLLASSSEGQMLSILAHLKSLLSLRHKEVDSMRIRGRTFVLAYEQIQNLLKDG